MRSARLWFLALLCAFLIVQRSPAQRALPLTIDTIMRGPGLYGFEPQDVRWSGDSSRVYFSWKQASDNPESPRDTYMIYRDRGAPIKLNETEARNAPPVTGNRTRDRKRAVYAVDGDIFLYDFSTDKSRQLTKTADQERFPHFTQDEKRVAFTRDNNLYILSLDSGLIEQMTELKPPSARPAE